MQIVAQRSQENRLMGLISPGSGVRFPLPPPFKHYAGWQAPKQFINSVSYVEAHPLVLSPKPAFYQQVVFMPDGPAMGKEIL